MQKAKGNYCIKDPQHIPRKQQLIASGDTAVITGSEQDIMDIVYKMEEIFSNHCNLALQQSKTNQVVGDRHVEDEIRVDLNQQTLDQLKEFTYLGSILTGDGGRQRK